jgi:hypothetical protein
VTGRLYCRRRVDDVTFDYIVPVPRRALVDIMRVEALKPGELIDHDYLEDE